MQTVEVAPSQIDKELLAIWRNAAEQDELKSKYTGTDTTARVRVALANLILLSLTDEVLDPKVVDGLITDLCIRHPSRFFMLSKLDPNVKTIIPHIRTSVSSRCVLANSGKHICSEEVYIAADKDGSEVVPNLLMSLLVSDIDTSLILLSDIRDGAAQSQSGGSTLLGGIAAFCDRLLIDSMQFRDLSNSMAVIEQILQSSNRQIVDINWLRISKWRAAIAEQFNVETLRNSLAFLSEINLTFTGENIISAPKDIPGDALLLIAWLLSSLDCRVQSLNITGENIIVCECQNSGGKSLKAVLQRVNPANAAGAAMSKPRESVNKIEFTYSDDAPTGSLMLESVPKLGALIITTRSSDVHSNNKNVCDISVRKLPFTTPSLADLILTALSSGCKDDISEKALISAKALLQS